MIKRIRFKTQSILPRTQTQLEYINLIENNQIVIGLGAAGTGKTFLAVALAVKNFLSGEVHKIIITRPVLEAGEKLGFLPGDIEEKTGPYLRPIFDSLEKVLSKSQIQDMLKDQSIEIAPLAYMRGRTLEKSFIILDEAQNTTPQQMLMFLTRLGEGSTMVINGDPNQVDLPKHVTSGLTDASIRLHGIKNIESIIFSDEDVVRHPLLSDIIKAYKEK